MPMSEANPERASASGRHISHLRIPLHFKRQPVRSPQGVGRAPEVTTARPTSPEVWPQSSSRSARRRRAVPTVTTAAQQRYRTRRVREREALVAYRPEHNLNERRCYGFRFLHASSGRVRSRNVCRSALRTRLCRVPLARVARTLGDHRRHLGHRAAPIRRLHHARSGHGGPAPRHHRHRHHCLTDRYGSMT